MSDFLFHEILRPEAIPEIHIADPYVCFYCGSSPVPLSMENCPVCGFPQHGSKLQQMTFIEERREKVKEHEKREIIIGWAQTALLYTGLTAITLSVLSWFTFSRAGILHEQALSNFLYGILAALPNIAIWYWSKKQPFIAISVALGLTAVGVISQLIIGGLNITGILPSLMLMLVFTHALISYKEAVAIEKELIVAPRDLRNLQ